jgi:hypothetical protein
MLTLLLASAAVAIPADTTACATAVPVSTSKDIPALQKDAACFEAAATSDLEGSRVLTTAGLEAQKEQKLRLDRIDAIGKITCLDGTKVAIGMRCPDGSIMSPSPSGLADIASEFDPSTLLKPFGIPPSMGGDPLGAFRFTCGAGPLKYDDPIVFPGQPGRSHLHQFYGNTSVDGNSTFESLRTKGDGTCGGTNKGQTLSSAYWVMFDGKGGSRTWNKQAPNCIRPAFQGKQLPTVFGSLSDSKAAGNRRVCRRSGERAGWRFWSVFHHCGRS